MTQKLKQFLASIPSQFRGVARRAALQGTTDIKKGRKGLVGSEHVTDEERKTIQAYLDTKSKGNPL